MPIAPIKRNIAVVPAIVRIDSGLEINAHVAANPPQSAGGSVPRTVGRAFGRVMRAGAIRSAKLVTSLAKKQLSTALAASVCDADKQIGDVSTLTILIQPKSYAQNIVNTRRLFALNFGNKKWAIFKCFAQIVTASKLGKIDRCDIACERIAAAYAQGRLFA